MLASFALENFRSYREASLALGPLTVLIGANAAGKSNAIEALRLLSWIAAGNKLGGMRHSLQDKERALRGTIGDLGFRKVRTFTLSCETSAFDWRSYSVTLNIREDGELHISGERVTGLGYSSSAPLFEVVTPSTGALGDIVVAYNNFARGGKKPHIICNDQTAVLCQLMSSARFYGTHRKAQREIPETRRFHQQLSTITFLDPRPSLMDQATADQRLTESGDNLSGVLYNLCQDEDSKGQVLEFIRALPQHSWGSSDCEVMVALTGRSAEAQLVTRHASSDGTLRLLAIAAAILAAPGDLVVIEEIDNGVHPSRAAQLLDQISRIAKNKNLRVLISNHNPALLDALPDDAVPHAVFCYRDRDDGSSRLVRLADIPDYPELIAQGSVGHLMTRGIIERFVKHHPGAERRKERAVAWLNELRKKQAR